MRVKCPAAGVYLTEGMEITMQTIIIDEEFKGLLPVLDKETFDLLEENILENGCRDPLVLWGDILIDGHNRYAICMEHDIPFDTVSRDFECREDVLIWIITAQVSRRNLTAMQLSYFRGVHYRTLKKKQGSNNQYAQKSENSQNGDFQKSAVRVIGERYNVSPRTVTRDNNISTGIDAIGKFSSDAKRKVLSGEAKVNKKYLEKIGSFTDEEAAEIAAAIENGTFENPKPEKPAGASPETPGAPPYGSAPSGTPWPQWPPDGFAGPGPGYGPDPGPGWDGVSLDAIISRISYDCEFYSRLPENMNGGDVIELRAALRSYIDVLESVYRKAV